MAKMIRIVAKKEGFRRAGIAHGTAPAHYPLDRFAKSQLIALKGEPMLVVDEVDVADPAPKTEPAGKGPRVKPEDGGKK
jgi:hypothetical protein